VDFVYYPTQDFDPLMKGMVIGGLGILHVFLAQFAIGGGILMAYFQWLAMTNRCASARLFLDGYFKAIVLLSFVLGALTGVGMWFTTIQISPRTIGMMVHNFHWIWAVEWTFFCQEIVAGYAYYRYSAKLSDSSRLTLLILYSVAAWFSLFWINGILSWQLTPADWLRCGGIWAGFFNPGFWPSLFFRTVTAMTIASLMACVVVNLARTLDRDARTTVIRSAARFLLPMATMPFLGLWYLQTMPADSRSWVLGGSAAMTMFLILAIAASTIIGMYAWIGLLLQRLYINGATATMLCAMAFAATAGGEFVREGARKPYTIRETLYSNSIRKEEVARLRQTGIADGDPYSLRGGDEYPNDQLRLGTKVFRLQCSICHTMAGVNGLVHLAGTWTMDQRRMNIAKLQHTKPFMPPFAGTPKELESLVQWISWNASGRPKTWAESDDPRILLSIQRWLDEAGTEPVPIISSRIGAERG